MDFFTDPLRITLLIAGVIVVVAIYFFGRRPRPRLSKDSLAPENRAVHPSEYQDLNQLGAEVGEVKVIREAPAEEAMEMPQISPQQPPEEESPSATGQAVAAGGQQTRPAESVEASPAESSGQPERFIILHIKADDNRPYQGSLLINVLQETGLVYGAHQIFHYEHKRGKRRELWFSVANMLEPGSFDLENIDRFQTRGLSLFMRLPMPEGSGVPAFTQMMACAQRLTQKLGGQLLDENHQPLTVAAITRLHKEVESYEKQLSLI